jgi:hypothetical protein
VMLEASVTIKSSGLLLVMALVFFADSGLKPPGPPTQIAD